MLEGQSLLELLDQDVAPFCGTLRCPVFRLYLEAVKDLGCITLSDDAEAGWARSDVALERFLQQRGFGPSVLKLRDLLPVPLAVAFCCFDLDVFMDGLPLMLKNR
ncbi:hypothetical protein D3C77_703430 [compost metagenome]